VTLQDFIGEENLLGALKLKRSQLDRLRHQGLPFIALGLTRVYSVPSLCEFFMSREKVLNRALRGETKDTPKL